MQAIVCNDKKSISAFIESSIYMLLCIFAYFLQQNLYLHKDVAIITHTATQFLQGQTYAQNIFEPNPPIIFYLHWIPIIIAKLSGIAILPIFRLYVITLAGISLHFSLRLFNEIRVLNGPYLYKYGHYIVAYGLTYIVLFLPAEAFGQREHFYVILCLPYIFLAACRLHAIPLNISLVIVVGCMAGIGFAIKPVFLPMLGLINLLFIYQTKRLFAWVRLESILCMTILGGYALFVFLIYPNYFHIVLPFWMPYYLGIMKHWTILIGNPAFLWCCVAMCLSILFSRTILQNIIGICIFGNIITYLIPQVDWYYHLYPALAMSCLYVALLLSELAYPIQNIYDFLLTCSIATIIFLIPVAESGMRTYQAITYFHSNNPEKKLAAILNQYPNNNHYMLFSMTHNLYTLEWYSNAHPVGRLSFFHWEYTRTRPYSIDYMHNIRSYALNIITQDLNKEKPRFVIVDNPSSEMYLKHCLDFSKEYRDDDGFHAAWQHYTYLTSIYPYDLYKRSS